MISLTSEYALRALIYLAQHADEWPVPGRTIAKETKVPRKYLSSILGDLVRAGVLDSTPGPGGGFSMVRSPKKTLLIEVLAPFESSLDTPRPCPFGNTMCGDADPCTGHAQWKKVQEAYSRFLRETSVHGIAFKTKARRATGTRKKRKKR